MHRLTSWEFFAHFGCTVGKMRNLDHVLGMCISPCKYAGNRGENSAIRLFAQWIDFIATIVSSRRTRRIFRRHGATRTPSKTVLNTVRGVTIYNLLLDKEIHLPNNRFWRIDFIARTFSYVLVNELFIKWYCKNNASTNLDECTLNILSS